MKFEPSNDRYLTVAVYGLICALVVSVFAVALFNLSDVWAALRTFWRVLKPIVYGIVFAAIISMPARFFEERVFAFLDRVPRAPSQKLPRPVSRFIRRVRSVTHRNPSFKRGCALAVTYAIIVSFIIGFTVLVVPQVITSYRELTEVAPKYLASAQRWLDNVLDSLPLASIDTGIDLPGAPQPDIEDVERALRSPTNPLSLTVDEAASNETGRLVRDIGASGLRLDLSDIIKRGLALALGLMSDAMPQILGMLGTVVTELKNIALGLIISFYLLFRREKLLAQLLKFMSSWLPAPAVEALAKVGRITGRTFTEFVSGKIIDAIVIGVLCTVSMLIFRMPYPALIGMLVGTTNVIPYLGPFLGAVPGAIIIFIVNPTKAVWFVLLIIVLQQLDCNFIEPYIVGDKTGLASIYIITSVIVMGGIFGVPGLFLGVPAFAVIYALVKDWSEGRLAKKSLPTGTVAYADDAEIAPDTESS